jgi:hypothetical protein
LFAVLKFLAYALAAVIIVTLILSNTHPVSLELFIIPAVTVPLYALIAVAFIVGLSVGLLYAAKCAVVRRLFSPDSSS